MSNILITGNHGFLGNALFQRLKYDHGIIGLAQDICEPIECDQRIDQIYNLAGTPSPAKYLKDPIRTAKTNTVGIFNILDFAVRTRAKLFQASTGEVDADDNHLGKRSCYRLGKKFAEYLCEEYKRQFNLSIRILRMYNSYGPDMKLDDGRVIPEFIRKALLNEDIILYGGKQTRSFCYVDDMIDGMIKMMESDINFPVNICSPEEIEIGELAHLIVILTNSNSKVLFKPKLKEDQEQINPIDNLAQDILGWEPKVNLINGLLLTIESFKRRLHVGKEN
jgi:UDP-glucuronate decarboxylase